MEKQPHNNYRNFNIEFSHLYSLFVIDNNCSTILEIPILKDTSKHHERSKIKSMSSTFHYNNKRCLIIHMIHSLVLLVLIDES